MTAEAVRNSFALENYVLGSDQQGHTNSDLVRHSLSRFRPLRCTHNVVPFTRIDKGDSAIVTDSKIYPMFYDEGVVSGKSKLWV